MLTPRLLISPTSASMSELCSAPGAITTRWMPLGDEELARCPPARSGRCLPLPLCERVWSRWPTNSTVAPPLAATLLASSSASARLPRTTQRSGGARSRASRRAIERPTVRPRKRVTTKASRLEGLRQSGYQRALGEEEDEAGEDREVEELRHLVERGLVDQVLVAVVEAEGLRDDDQDDGSRQGQQGRRVALDHDHAEPEGEGEGEGVAQGEQPPVDRVAPADLRVGAGRRLREGEGGSGCDRGAELVGDVRLGGPFERVERVELGHRDRCHRIHCQPSFRHVLVGRNGRRGQTSR